MNRINLVVLLEQLEELVEKAPEIPLTGRVLLDADELLELIDQIRSSVPEEVRRAEAVSVEKDRVIAEGQQKAERIIAQLEEYAARLIRESEIHRQAEQEARRILDEASQRAQEITRGVRTTADQILSNLQSALERPSPLYLKPGRTGKPHYRFGPINTTLPINRPIVNSVRQCSSLTRLPIALTKRAAQRSLGLLQYWVKTQGRPLQAS